MVIIMEHTINWLSSIGYDISYYTDTMDVEWKGTYAKLTDKDE